MRQDIERRVLHEAEYVIQTKDTIRNTPFVLVDKRRFFYGCGGRRFALVRLGTNDNNRFSAPRRTSVSR